MLDREDSTYFNLQGSMIYDPAINEDVPLVEGMLFCTAAGVHSTIGTDPLT